MSKKRKNRLSRTLVPTLVVLLCFSLAPAAEATDGYFMHGIGTRAKAMGGAGVALPLDALAAGTNPAGMVFVGKRYDIGAGLFNPRRSYTIEGNPSGFPGTFGLAPGKVQSDSEYFLVPNFGANWMLGEDASFGLSVYGQGGMNTDYPTATFHGTPQTGVDYSQLFIVPTYARKFGGGRNSFGISPILVAQFFEARGLQAFGPFSSAPENLTNNGHDSSFGIGVKVGYLGQWSDSFSFGATYQSKVSMNKFDDYAGLFAEQGGFDIPSNYVVGIAYRFGDSAVLAFDVKEIKYSDTRSVNNPFLPNLATSPLGTADGAGFGWEDVTIFKIGFQWQTGESWTWRVGFSTLDQPIPETEVMFNIIAPGVVEDHFTFGFTRELASGRAINFALMHAPSVSVKGPNPLEAPGFQTITIEMSQWDFEIGYSWGF